MAAPLSPRAQAIFDAGTERRRAAADAFAASGTLGDEVQRRMRRKAHYELAVAFDRQEAARLAHVEERVARNLAFNSGSASPCGPREPAAFPLSAAGSTHSMPGLTRLLSNIIQHGKAA